MNIGFIGIGQMGRHIAQHILNAGYDISVNDCTREKAQHLLEKGAKWRDTPKDLAKSCEVVFSCLPGPIEVENVVHGGNGLIAGWKRGDIYVDMSTNSPTTIRRVAEKAKNKGVEVLEAPVSGGTQGAAQGTLTIMVGGSTHTLERVRGILQAIGSKIFHVGDVGCGNIAKLVNNMIALSCAAITAEGLVLGAKAGIELKQLLQVVTASSGNNYMLEKKYPLTALRGNFEPGYKINLALKDLRLALALAKEHGVPQPLATNVEQRFLEAKASGLDDKDCSAIIVPLERIAGVEVRIPRQLA